MKNFPVRNQRAKTGSNLRGDAVVAQRGRATEKFRRQFARLSRDYQRAVKKLLPKADRRRAVEIAKRIRGEYHTANLKLGAEAAKWSANKKKFAAKLRRELAESLPNYRAWQALSQAHHREVALLAKRETAALLDRGIVIDWDNLPEIENETFEFTPPFAMYETYISADEGVEVTDLSYVIPRSGELVNDVKFKQDYQPLIATDIYGVNWPSRHVTSTVCGINFVTPIAGRLRLRATLRNFYNNITASAHDYFGFSEAILRIHLQLSFVILQPGQRTELSTTLVTDGFDSHGNDLNFQFPELDTTIPYTFETTTTESFPAHTGLQILAGTDIYIQSEVDDMRTEARALLWWQLQKLEISMA